MYEYRAKVIKIVDGDTIDCQVDLGFNMQANLRFRLARINTPEVRGKEREQGLISKQWLSDSILDKDIIVRTGKTGKYGRWIAEILFNGVNMNDELVKQELAEYVNY